MQWICIDSAIMMVETSTGMFTFVFNLVSIINLVFLFSISTRGLRTCN